MLRLKNHPYRFQLPCEPDIGAACKDRLEVREHCALKTVRDNRKSPSLPGAALKI
jgi:hypothetical protein